MKIFVLLFLSLGILPSPRFAEAKIAYDQKKDYSELNKNWFDDDYIIKKTKAFYDEVCNSLLKGASKKAIKRCKSRDENSADFARVTYCVFYIAREWPEDLLSSYKEEIKDDCKRLYFNYKDNENFLPQGFSNKYIAFVKGKKLPFYDGPIVDGLKSGFGSYYFENEEKYIGDFQGNQFHGKGKYFFNSGTKDNPIRTIVNGTFVNSQIHGVATSDFYINNLYAGKFVVEWVKNKINGEGIRFDKNGKIVEQGIFKDGFLIESRKIDLSKLLRRNISSKMNHNNKHEKCLKASDYKGCMNYQKR